jgi:hypothetical protein
MQHFVHGLGTENAEYLDMTSGGVFVHCMVEEGKSILDRIISITPLEDLQIKALLISEDELIITYLDTSNISALLAWEELLQLIVEEDCFTNDIGNSSKAPTCELKGLKLEPTRQDLE